MFVANAHRGDGKRFIVRADSSARANSGANFEEEGQAKLLHWCEKKGVRLSVNRAVAYDLADVVNPIGFPQDPTGV